MEEFLCSPECDLTSKALIPASCSRSELFSLSKSFLYEKSKGELSLREASECGGPCNLSIPVTMASDCFLCTAFLPLYYKGEWLFLAHPSSNSCFCPLLSLYSYQVSQRKGGKISLCTVARVFNQPRETNSE